MFRGAKTAGMMAGGGLLGGLGGQVSDALSAPRRAMWEALGLPDSGAQLVGNLTGMDPEGFGAGALGMGAEMLLDPLTLAGAFGGAAGRVGTGALGLAGDARSVGSLERFAQQAMQAPRFAEEGAALRGVGGGMAGIGEASAPLAAGRMVPPGFSPSALPELQPNEISELLAKLENRVETPGFSSQMMPESMAGAGTPNLPSAPGGPNFSMTADQIRAGGLQPSLIPPGQRGGADFMQMMQQHMAGQAPSPQELAALPATTPAPPPAPMGQPFALPPDMGPGAGLGQSYGAVPAAPFRLPPDMRAGAGLGQGYPPQAMGGVPMPNGGSPYKLVGTDVQALLRELGMMPELGGLSKGGLPPWAQVRGGRVGMAPGVLPQDVMRGATGAAGY